MWSGNIALDVLNRILDWAGVRLSERQQPWRLCNGPAQAYLLSALRLGWTPKGADVVITDLGCTINFRLVPRRLCAGRWLLRSVGGSGVDSHARFKSLPWRRGASLKAFKFCCVKDPVPPCRLRGGLLCELRARLPQGLLCERRPLRRGARILLVSPKGLLRRVRVMARRLLCKRRLSLMVDA